MFLLRKLFGKEDEFFGLLEASAREAHASVQALVKLSKSLEHPVGLEEFARSRRKDKQITSDIRHAIHTTFATALEREDIDELSRALYRIPKTVEKLAERIALGHDQVAGVNFVSQIEIMEEATDVLLAMIKQLRDMKHVEKMRDMNSKLQYLEGEADKLMLGLLKELYSGKYDALRAMIIRDLYELMEKVIDRCRDTGNVVMHIVLKNS